MTLSSLLVVGASRGLGQALIKHYATLIDPSNIFATIRSTAQPDQFPKGVNVIENVDCMEEDCGKKVVEGLQGRSVEGVVYVAGVLKPEVGRAG